MGDLLEWGLQDWSHFENIYPITHIEQQEDNMCSRGNHSPWDVCKWEPRSGTISFGDVIVLCTRHILVLLLPSVSTQVIHWKHEWWLLFLQSTVCYYHVPYSTIAPNYIKLLHFHLFPNFPNRPSLSILLSRRTYWYFYTITSSIQFFCSR